LDKTNIVIAEFSIVPVGTGETSVSHFVAAAIQAFREIKGLKFEVTSMGTILVAENLDIIFDAVRRAHDAVIASGTKRIVSTLRLDDRRDKPRRIQDKVEAIEGNLSQTDHGQ